MPRSYLLGGLLLASTVPMVSVDARVLGLPAWTFASMAMTVVYALTVARQLGRHFDRGPALDDGTQATSGAAPGEAAPGETAEPLEPGPAP